MAKNTVPPRGTNRKYDWEALLKPGGRVRVPRHSMTSNARSWALANGYDYRFAARTDPKDGHIYIHKV